MGARAALQGLRGEPLNAGAADAQFPLAKFYQTTSDRFCDHRHKGLANVIDSADG